MKALERQSLAADRAAVASMLARMPAGDILGRRSFEARLEEIDRRLRELDAQGDFIGRVALIFRGEPVSGSRSIDAAFASSVLKSFQDAVSKRVAVEGAGELGERGPLPLRLRANLGVSSMVRGSVGFVLEEQASNEALAETSVGHAIDEVATLIEKTASEDPNQFEEATQRLDSRILVSLREFFSALDDSRAQVRIVERDREADLDAQAVRRGRDRLESTEIEERPDEILLGELLGLLPEARRFEMRLQGGELIRGTVAAQYAERYLALIEQPNQGIIGRWWRVRMKVREVRERNKPMRRLYALLGLIEEAPRPE